MSSGPRTVRQKLLQLNNIPSLFSHNLIPKAAVFYHIMKAVVLYRSKYGSTKQYAEWIAEELGADIFPADAFSPEQFALYDTVVFGAPVFGGAVLGIAAVADHMDVLRDKRLFVFTVGLTPPDAEQSLADLAEKNYPATLMKHAEFFHFRGALDAKKLTFGHKILLKMINSSMRNKLDMHQNHVSRKAIFPLTEAARGEKNA